MKQAIEAIGTEELAQVTGGLAWEGHPQSTNVEDRRTGGWTEAMEITTMGDFARWDRTFGPAVSSGSSGGGGWRDWLCTYLAC